MSVKGHRSRVFFRGRCSGHAGCPAKSTYARLVVAGPGAMRAEGFAVFTALAAVFTALALARQPRMRDACQHTRELLRSTSQTQTQTL